MMRRAIARAVFAPAQQSFATHRRCPAFAFAQFPPTTCSFARCATTARTPSASSGSDGSGDWREFVSRNVKRNWFTLSLPFVLFACYEQPDYMCTGGTFAADRWKDGAIVAMFFFTGLGMALGDVRQAVTCWRAHAMIQSASFLFAPMLFVLLVVPVLRALGFPEAVQHGALFLSCVPTSIGVSLALTRMAGGDVGIAVVNSAIGNLVGVALTPIIAQALVGASAPIDVADVVRKLMTVLLVPWIAGLALRQRYGARLKRWGDMGVFREAQTVALLTLLIHVFSNAFQHDKPVASVAAVGRPGGVPSKATSDVMSFATPSMIAKLAAVLLAAQLTLMGSCFVASRAIGLSRPVSVASALCGSQKTAAMGIPLLMLVYHDQPELLPALTLPILCYHPMQAVFGGVAASTVLRRAAVYAA